jgi:LmbE family N-acetylglucosaminyl deacetylase
MQPVRHDEGGPTVVLSPHCDDAVLSVWHVVGRPGPVEVVSVCTALPEPGTLGTVDPLFGVTDSAELMALRLAEDSAALARAGRHRILLDFMDGQYRVDPLVPAEVAAAASAAVVTARRLYAPAGIGAHADHLAVRAAALELSAAGGIPLSLYSDLPYAARFGWPAWVTGAAPRPHLVPEAAWRSALDTFGWPVREDDRRPVHLSADEMAQKLEALRAYDSQFEMLNGGPVGLLSNPDILGFELYWDVSPGPST